MQLLFRGSSQERKSMPPKKGEPGYEEYRKAYNERRNRRRQDPEYVARFNARKRKQYRRRKEAKAADE